MRHFRPRLLAGIALVLLLAAAACSNDDGGSGVEAGGDTTEAATAGGDDGAPAEATSTSPESGEGSGEGSTETAALDHTSEIYADASHWLCRPDLAESPCETDLDVTVVNEDGTTEVRPHTVATDAPFDCFYVYPTINMTGEGNAPFDGEYGPELGVTRTQAARFSSICDVYAPVYRQITMSSFAAPNAEELLEVAYGDVEDAFLHYLANDNDGRPFVLLGHSQGSGMINQLIRNQIDGDEARRQQLISALVIGSAVSVPEGEDVGGDFDHIPACRVATQTGCVVSFASFRADVPPPADSLFGRPREGDGVALCTNPAALEGGKVPLSPVYPSANDAWAEGATDVPAIETSWIAFPGLLEGECVSGGGFNYLAVTVNGDPSGPRVDDISGDLTPPWGLHAVDYNLVMDDLVALVDQQAQAHQAES